MTKNWADTCFILICLQSIIFLFVAIVKSRRTCTILVRFPHQIVAATMKGIQNRSIFSTILLGICRVPWGESNTALGTSNFSSWIDLKELPFEREYFILRGNCCTAEAMSMSGEVGEPEPDRSFFSSRNDFFLEGYLKMCGYIFIVLRGKFIGM